MRVPRWRPGENVYRSRYTTAHLFKDNKPMSSSRVRDNALNQHTVHVHQFGHGREAISWWSLEVLTLQSALCTSMLAVGTPSRTMVV